MTLINNYLILIKVLKIIYFCFHSLVNSIGLAAKKKQMKVVMKNIPVPR